MTFKSFFALEYHELREIQRQSAGQTGYAGAVIADTKSKGSLLVDLKYNNGLPVIREITRVSKPGRRIYTKADSIPKIQSGLGIAIVSTSMGIMSDNDARSKNIGGEIICRVF